MGAIHLRHMHADLKLTFGEIKGLLNSVAAGDIEAIEKFDGQSVFFTCCLLYTSPSPRDRG